MDLPQLNLVQFNPEIDRYFLEWTGFYWIFHTKSPTLSRIYCSLIQKYRYYFIYFLHFHENFSFVSIIYLTNNVEWTINRCKNEYILMSKWLQPGIHTPLGSRTGRCELVRYISVFIGAGELRVFGDFAVLVRLLKHYVVLVTFNLYRCWIIHKIQVQCMF